MDEVKRFCCVCGTEISEGSAQYGLWSEPMCRWCFLSGKEPERKDTPKEQLSMDLQQDD